MLLVARQERPAIMLNGAPWAHIRFIAVMFRCCGVRYELHVGIVVKCASDRFETSEDWVTIDRPPRHKVGHVDFAVEIRLCDDFTEGVRQFKRRHTME